MRLYLPLSFLLIACAAPEQASRSSTYEAESFNRIDIRGAIGDLNIKVGNVGDLQASLEWRDDTPPEFRTRLIGNTLLVITSCPARDNACRIDLDVELPEEADIDARIEAGDITVTGLRGLIDVATDAGTIRLVETRGAARARTGSGDLLLTSVSSRLDVTADAGAITGTEVRSPTIKARSYNEPIDLRFADRPDILEGWTDNGDVTIALPRGSYDIDANSKRGDVEITEVANSGEADSILILQSVRGNITVTGL